MNFQSTVLTIAVVLLLLCMILISIALVKTKNTEQWPPIIGDCPDYWIDLSGNGAQCVNMKDLGTCNGSVSEGQHMQMNFTVHLILVKMVCVQNINGPRVAELLGMV